MPSTLLELSFIVAAASNECLGPDFGYYRMPTICTSFDTALLAQRKAQKHYDERRDSGFYCYPWEQSARTFHLGALVPKELFAKGRKMYTATRQIHDFFTRGEYLKHINSQLVDPSQVGLGPHYLVVHHEGGTHLLYRNEIYVSECFKDLSRALGEYGYLSQLYTCPWIARELLVE